MPRHKTGFTLVELLVVIVVLALLIGLMLPAINGARQHAKMVREMSGCRTTMLAFYMYAEDRNGTVVPGYKATGEVMKNARGDIITNGASLKRYPWKLAPYVGFAFTDSMLVHSVKRDIENLDDYAMSLSPSFGINSRYIGGHESYWMPYIQRIDQPSQPSSLIVFASARYYLAGGPEEVEGYHEVWPPTVDEYVSTSNSADFGQVHPRYFDSAVIGFFDYHAGRLSQRELRDMRYWINEAAKAGNPNLQ